MKIYFNLADYYPEKRAFLADVLKPFINNRTLEQNVAIYGPQVRDYHPVESVEAADLCVLTMGWSYYFETCQLEHARAFLRSALEAGKPAVVWQGGDYSLQFDQEDVYLFQAGGQCSTRAALQYTFPVFIQDPLKEVDRENILIRERGSRPVVGFCGQATADPVYAGGMRLRTAWYNLRSKLGLSPYEPVHWTLLPARLRWRALKKLEDVPNIRCNFIKRRRYRAGANHAANRARSRGEFLQNMLESDYIVCMRGGGNFSVRLYETLAMGRIPIFINTDCILPYGHSLPWRDFCVWVEVGELDSLPQKVLEFHNRLDADAFRLLQRQCRGIWQEYLTFSGFFKHFPEHFGMNTKCD